MTTPFIQPGHGADGVGRTPNAGARPETNKSGGVAFKALLERLQAQAAEREQSSRTVDGAAELSSAVDVARASLDDAMSLSDQLLEAYRHSKHLTGPEQRESA